MLTDIKLALRLLAKSPGFTLVAVLTLAIGMGVVTIAFSAVNAVLLKPYPYIQHQERMLHVTETDRERGADDIGINYADFLDLQSRMTTLDGIWVHTDRTVILAGKNEPERLLGTELSWNGFKLMGVAPVLGRNFTVDDSKLESQQVALLSYGLWQRRFGSDPDVINTIVTLNGSRVQIIGVMPKGWGYPETTTIWTVLRPTAELATQRARYYLGGNAMMKPGVTLRQVQTEADAIMRAVALENPTTNRSVGTRFRDVREEATDDVGNLLLLLLGAVSFVFLIACLNVANLILARSVTRSKEIAIRLALGAARRRLIAQFVMESLVLSVLGGVGGFLVSLWGLDAMHHGINTDLPFWLQPGFDGRVFAVVFGMTVIAALIFGLIPALQFTRPDVARKLNEGGRGPGDGGPAGNRLRQIFVVTEIALALVLLVGAGLMMRSFQQLRHLDLGFDPKNILTFRVGLPPSMVESDDVSAQFFTALLPRLAALPGVETASGASTVPLSHSNNMRVIQIEGKPAPESISKADIGQDRIVIGDYFRTLHTPLLAGRWFDPAIDRKDSLRVVIVDEAFAQRHYSSSQAALGKRFAPLNQDAKEAPDWMVIVGVVGNLRNRIERPDPQPSFYVPFAQDPTNFMTLLLRTKADPTTFLAAARTAVSGVNKDIPIYNIYSMEALFQRSAWSQKFFGQLFTIAGIIALFLAAIGVYGVMSYSVAQRTTEIGVRMALGAQSGAVVSMMLKRGLRLVVIGLLIGFVGSWFAAQLLSGTLYGISPHDPLTFIIVPIILAAIALIACYVPSRRATKVDPMVALRAE